MAVNIHHSIMDAIADFIVSQPTLEAIAAYQMPESLDARLHELLEKNREEVLLPEEREEMERFLLASHLMILAKAKARLKLEGKA